MRCGRLPLLLLLLTLSSLAADGNYPDEERLREDSRATRSEIRDPGSFGLLRLDALGSDTPGDVCYMLRTYKVEREEGNPDATRIVAEYQCQHASRFSVKRAKPRRSPDW
jgi:hypothetical protein